MDSINEGALPFASLSRKLALQLTDLVLWRSTVTLSALRPSRSEDQSHHIDLRYTAGLLF